MKLVKLMVALAWWFPGIGAICLSPVPQEEDPYRKGLEIMKNQGAAAGIEHFRTLTLEKEDDPTSFFYYAWALWREGYVDESQKAALFLTTKVEAESVLMGHCHYLLANISRQKGKLENSRNHTSEAIRIYQNHDLLSSLFKAFCTMAALEIEAKNFPAAHWNLTRAWQIYQSDQNSKKKNDLGYYYELKSRVGFAKGLYQSALDYAIDSHEEYSQSKDLKRATNALASVAFFKLLVGRIEEGIEDTNSVDEVIYSSEGYSKLSYYNAVNWVLIYRCSGYEYQDIEKDILNAISRDQDMYLKEHLDFVLNWKCEE